MTTPTMSIKKKTTEVSNYQSGFCGIGSHEGVVKLSPGGKPLKSCPVGGRFEMFGFGDRDIGQAECMCECHAMSREMEDISGIKFPARNSIRDSAPLSGLGLLDDRHAGTGSAKAADSVDVDRPTVAVASGRTFAVTPSGRAARGQLEESVRHFVCLNVKAGGEDIIAELGLTPAFLASMIDPKNPPSSGAVYSVLKRWEAAAMIELAESPFRFIRFTDRGKRELFK